MLFSKCIREKRFKVKKIQVGSRKGQKNKEEVSRKKDFKMIGFGFWNVGHDYFLLKINISFFKLICHISISLLLKVT